MYLQKVALSVSNRQNYYVSHSLPHNIYRINSSSLFHCFHPLYTTFFTMDVQKQPRGCHCFGMRSRSRYISQFPSGEGLEISVFSSGIKEVKCRVVAGWWFQKTCLLESPPKIGDSKPTWNSRIYIFLRMVDTESFFAHIRFIEILWIHQGSWFYGGDYDEVWWALKYFDKTMINYETILQ